MRKIKAVKMMAAVVLMGVAVFAAGCGGGGSNAGGSRTASMKLRVELPRVANSGTYSVTYTASIDVLSYNASGISSAAVPATSLSIGPFTESTGASVTETMPSNPSFFIANIPPASNYIVRSSLSYVSTYTPEAVRTAAQTTTETQTSTGNMYYGAIVESVTAGNTSEVTLNAVSSAVALAAIQYARVRNAPLSDASVISDDVIEKLEAAVAAKQAQGWSPYSMLYSLYNSQTQQFADPFNVSNWTIDFITVLNEIITSADLEGGSSTPTETAGTVQDSSGNPVSGARVVTGSSAEALVSAVTGAGGAYAMSSVPAGMRVFAASASGRVTDYNVVVVPSSGSYSLPGFTLMEYTGTAPAAAPTLTIGEPSVSDTGTAAISGQAANLDSERVVVVVNGDETLISTDSSGYYNYTAILRLGTNTISVRATNAVGTSFSEVKTVNFSGTPGNYLFRVTMTWDTTGDMDLHVWDPAGNQSYYGNTQIATGWLDVDNTSGYGPENFTCSAPTAGRYYVGVHYYGGSNIINATVKISKNLGTPQESEQFFGPYTFTAAGGDSDPFTNGNTGSWWRPFDVVVDSNLQTVTVTTPQARTGARTASALPLK